MRLLIVEDNCALLKSLKKGLQEEGFTVDAAADGEEGLFLAEHNGKDVPLRPKEYALLEFLAHHAGEVVPRSMIWEHLYDWQDESVSNTIDVFISRLRKKIDRPGLPPLIHTARGAGYRLKGG